MKYYIDVLKNARRVIDVISILDATIVVAFTVIGFASFVAGDNMAKDIWRLKYYLLIPSVFVAFLYVFFPSQEAIEEVAKIKEREEQKRSFNPNTSDVSNDFENSLYNFGCILGMFKFIEEHKNETK